MDITTQLCDRIDGAATAASEAMNDETANRQVILETLLAHVAAATFEARRAPRTGPVVIGNNSGQVAGTVHGDMRWPS